ncbi:hypothetical protein HQ585_08725 [candidate division KSB1 bacterium]|nr:hypothetical protein [candidate division KSB1 bacterium]
MLKKILPIVIVILLFLTQCQQPLEGLDLLFPTSKVLQGWKWEGTPDHYNPDNLYELINGEAELYHAYGFQELAIITYYAGSPEDSFFTASIYDMGSHENAFGVYSSYRYPGYDFDTIGVEGMISDYGVKFYKGNYFVDISFGDVIASVQHTGLLAATQIAENISGPAEAPGVIQMLPTEGQVAQSLRYAASEMLNQSFLPAGVEAQYVLDGEEMIGFVILFESAEQAVSGFEQLKKFYSDLGSKTEQMKKSEYSSFSVKTKYQGSLIAIQKDGYIVGARELQNLKQGNTLIEMILTELE